MRLIGRAAAAGAVALAVSIGPAGATYRGANGSIAFPEFAAGAADIYAVGPDGSERRRLTDAPGTDTTPAYSPDGSLIAFASDRERRGVYELYVMKADGSDERRITSLRGRAMFPDFSPDGRRLVFTGSARGSTQRELYVVDVDGSGLRRLTRGRGHKEQPAWSPDGRRIAFIRSPGQLIYVMNGGGTRPRRLTARKGHFAVDWSPDGRRLVYDEGIPGYPTSIWVMRADGSGKRQLTPARTPVRDFGPAWSPDGRRIVFVRAFDYTQPGSRQALHVMGANGRGVRPLVAGGKQFVPAWQPR